MAYPPGYGDEHVGDHIGDAIQAVDPPDIAIVPGPATELSLSADRWVRVMADYSSDGLWHRDGCAANIDELPVSATVKSRLAAWCAHYEDCDNFLPPGHPERGVFPRKAHSAEGLEIAKLIKAELPEWTVVYFDECRCSTDVNQPRSEFEYEVALSPATTIAEHDRRAREKAARRNPDAPALPAWAQVQRAYRIHMEAKSGQAIARAIAHGPDRDVLLGAGRWQAKP